MKILHIIKSLGRGGAETLLPETLRLHYQEQFEFHYVYFLPWKDQMVSAIQEAGGRVTCFAATNNIYLLLQYRSLIRYVRENKIDIIHCHLPWAGLVGRLIHSLTGIPVLYTEHNKQERYHWITRLLNRLTFNWQSTAIGVSADVVDSIKKNIPIRIPVAEILNGVNTDTFIRNEGSGADIRKKLDIPPDSIVVGTVAVFRFQKRLKEWLELFQKITLVNKNVYGIIVGDGPLKDELVAYRKQLNLEDKVFFPGLQTEVKPWLSAIDIYMMTSIFEGLPIALLEAMSMECAVVTTDAGGIKEVVRHTQDGLVVPADQWKQLQEHVERLCSDDVFRKSIGQAARKRVEDQFGLTRMVRALELLYRSYEQAKK